MAELKGSVGRGGANATDDVKLVQRLLNRSLQGLPHQQPLIDDGVMGPMTIAAIENFQKYYLHSVNPDGRVDPDGPAFKKLTSTGRPTTPHGTTIPITITGKSLPPGAHQVLVEILTAAGLSKAQVTSVTRTAADQARIMYEAIQLHGAKYSFDLYSGAGDKVTQIYVDNKTKPRDQVIALMQAKITEIGPSKVSLHCSSSHDVFDVAPSSISNGPAFLKAANAHPKVTRVLHPYSKPKDVAFHIEIPK